jgi:hypothetical protein
MDDGRDETPDERADRNLTDLLQELRVALPGVQVLFAFLLAVPFQDGFEDVTTFQRDVYFATLLFSAAAIALLIAPTPYHRLNFARGDKQHIVVVSGRLTLTGLGALAIAMTGAVLLVADWLFGTTVVVLTMVLVVSTFALAWFALPLRRRRTTEPRS